MISLGPRTVVILYLLSSLAASGWAYTSHIYDCFNIGPCSGDLNFWISLGDFALAAFFATWGAVLASNFLGFWSRLGFFKRACAWIIALLAPPGVLLAGVWWFNRGLVLAS